MRKLQSKYILIGYLDFYQTSPSRCKVDTIILEKGHNISSRSGVIVDFIFEIVEFLSVITKKIYFDIAPRFLLGQFQWMQSDHTIYKKWQ